MDNNTNKFDLSDKLATIIGFTIILMTIYNFNETIKNIEINFLIATYNLGSLILIGAGALILSLYLHAVNSIRFESPRLLNFKFLKYIEITGHGIYLTVLTTPAVLILLFFLNKLFELITRKLQSEFYFHFGNMPVNILITLILIALTVYSYKHYTKIDEDLIEEKQNQRKEASNKTKFYLKDKQYKQIPIQLYNQIKYKFQEILILEYGNNISKQTDSKIFSLAFQNGLLNGDDIQIILELKKLRNTLTHNKEEIEKISRQEITKQIENIDRILTKLNRK